MFLEVEQARSADIPEALEAGIGTTVSLQFEGASNEVFVLTEANARAILPEETSIDSPVGHKLVGRKEGEAIQWSPAPATPSQARLTRVKHRTVWAYQECMTTYPRRFPEDESLRAFKVTEDLRELKATLDEIHEGTTKALADYRARPMFVATLAEMLNRSLFDVWGALVSDRTLGILCCLNTSEERERECAAVRGKTVAVVDLLALFTLAHLDLLDVLPEVFRRIIVPQHAYESIRITRDQVAVHRKTGLKIVGRDDRGYVREEQTPERVETAVKFLERMTTFVEQRTERPGRPRAYTSAEADLFVPCVGEEVAVPVLVAASIPDALLLSDDAALREYAYRQYSTATANTWTLIDALFERQRLSPDDRTKKIGILLRMGYRSLPINADILFRLFSTNLDVRDDTYRLARDTVLNKRANMNSSLLVLNEFIRRLAFELSRSIAEDVLKDLLDVVWLRGGKQAIERLRALILQHGLIIVPALQELGESINRWLSDRPVL